MTASLTVLSGPLAGTRLDIDESEDEILVGSDPDCRLALDVAGVSPIHARLWQDQAGLTVHDTRSPRGVFVNDTRVDGEAVLRDGDVLWLGPPGDPDSVMLQCRYGGMAVAPEPPAEAAAHDPLADLADLFAAAPEEPPAAPAVPEPSVPAASHSAASDSAVSDDVFFMEEPAAPPVPAPVQAAPPPPPPPAPPPPPVPAAASDDLFFLEEPAAPPPPVPAAAPPPAPSVAVPKPPVPRPAAAAPAPTAGPPSPRPAAPARPVRHHGATGPPSMVAEDDEAPAAPRARSAPPRATPAPAAAARRGSGPPLGLIAGGAALVLALGAAGFFVLRAARTPAIASITPSRVGLGHSVTISGTHFGATPQDNDVRFGDKPGRVVQASATTLQVEIPELAAAPGRDMPVPVVVVVGGHESKAATLAVFESPRIHGIDPSVAMPGDEVVLAGAGWGAGAKVTFGPVAANVVDSTPASIKVRVPALEGAPGTEFPVRVAMGADTSNPAPFLLGRLPLLVSVAPPSAAPGDVVTLAGRGFQARPLDNAVRVAGARALVVSSTGAELKIVVPRVPAGEAALEVRVPGTENVAQAKLLVTAGPDPIDFHFVAEPFEEEAGDRKSVV